MLKYKYGYTLYVGESCSGVGNPRGGALGERRSPHCAQSLQGDQAAHLARAWRLFRQRYARRGQPIRAYSSAVDAKVADTVRQVEGPHSVRPVSPDTTVVLRSGE